MIESILPTEQEWVNLRDTYINVVDGFYRQFQHHNRSGALVHNILNQSMNLRERLRNLDDFYYRCAASTDQASIKLWLIFRKQVLSDIGRCAEIAGKIQ